MSSEAELEPTLLNQIKNIQTLIKKESSQKDIIIQIRDKLSKDIEKSNKALQENKLKILQKQEQKGNNQNYIISDNPSSLYAGASMYTQKLLLYIRKYQSIMYKILIQASPTQKQCLSSLLADFFYNNIFSSDSIQEELLIMLYRTLKYEIKSLSKKDKSFEFLKKSINKYILNSFAKNQDVKEYFSKVVRDLIDLFEGQEEKKDLAFDPQKLCELYSKQKALQYQKEKNQEKIETKTGNISFKKESDNFDLFFGSEKTSNILSSIIPTCDEYSFFENYVPDLNKVELQEKYEKETDTRMKDYIGKQINKAKSSKIEDDLFANKFLIENIFHKRESSGVFESYKVNFIIAIELINKFFSELGKTVTVIPNSIRYICKIISVLVKDRFPDISQVEINAFISEFFAKQIIFPLLVHPDLSGLLTGNSISNSTKNNLKIIGGIVIKFLSGEFYTSNEDTSMTLFNRYFMNQMPEILNFFDKLTNVNLPDVLENIIKNDLSKDKNEFDIETFVFDYFQEHPDEQIFYHNICYSAEQILTIIEIMQKNKETILQEPKNEMNGDDKREYTAFVKAFEKIMESFHLDSIKKVISNDKKANTKTFSLIIEKFYGSKLKAISKLKTKHFALPEISSPKNENERKMNNVIKVKNSLSEILYNIHNIPKRDFFGIKINNIDDFVDALTEISKINYYNLVDSIQTEWYIRTLRSLIYKVPDEYKQNNYEKLFEELAHDLKQSISQMDYDTMSIVVDSYRYLDKELRKSKQNIRDFKQIEFNTKVLEFINTTSVEVYLKSIEHENGQKHIEVCSKNINANSNKFKHPEQTSVEKKTRINTYYCQTVHQFTQIFPNIAKSFSSINKNSIFDFERDLAIPNALESYFSILKQAIQSFPNLQFIETMDHFESDTTKTDDKNKTEIKEEGLNRIYTKIVNYIMDKIYDRIFPFEPELDDYKVYQQCASLGWVEPQHLCSFGKINLEDFLPETVGYVNRLDITKNPFDKMNLFAKVEEIVLNTLNFMFGKCEGGVDDLLPLLIYIIIKSTPKNFLSNLKYIELYYFGMNSGKEGQRLVMLTAIKERLLDFKAEDLNGVTLEEYCR